MERWLARTVVLVALGVVALAFLLPVGALLRESFLLHEVVLKDGRVVPAVGEVAVKEDGRVDFQYQAEPGAERVNPAIHQRQVQEIRTRWSLHHYRFVLGDARIRSLVTNSLLVAGGGALAALLLGIPLGWLLFRTNVPGRRILLVLALTPAILPPFLVAMGGARRLMDALQGVFGLVGANLQMTSAVVVFGVVLSPLVAVLVGRALASVPAGPCEAALLLGGKGAAFRRVVVPAVLPALFGAGALVFVLAWSDFAVPDLLSFMLPPGSDAVNVFPTEILLQWKQGARARAVATGGPFLLVALALLGLAVFFLRRSPVAAGGEGGRGRPMQALGPAGRVLGTVSVLLLVAAGLVVPLTDTARWATDRGETVAQGGAGGGTQATSHFARLGDVQGALDRTPGSREDLGRWIRTGIGAALLAMFVAVVLARWALQGGRWARLVVLLLAVLPLAVPGLVYTVATTVFWNRLDAAWIERTPFRSVLALTARFLPFALLAAWAALREVRRGPEEAAALLGAGPLVRAWRIWGPPALAGILTGGLLVLVLALREIDTVIEVDARIFPLRIYDKIHFSRRADEANLVFLYVAILMAPALLAAAVQAWRLRRRPPG